MRRAGLLVLLLLAPIGVAAQPRVVHPPGVLLQDEGTTQGRATTLNCTGILTCTITGSVGTLDSTGAAPVGAQYWTGAADSTLTAEKNLGALSTGLVLNTGGVPSAYAGTSCTNQFPRSLSASGAATCATVSLTADITGTLGVGNGGTGAGAFTLGSVVFAGASGVYTQDNANFFYNTTNRRLGIGVSPTVNLDIVGIAAANTYARLTRAANTDDVQVIMKPAGALAAGNSQYSFGINASAADFSMSRWDGTTNILALTILETTGAVTLAVSANIGTAPATALAGSLFMSGKTQANLGTPTNGTMIYCSDCTIANPCAGGGTGALAKRLNAVWVCNRRRPVRTRESRPCAS